MGFNKHCLPDIVLVLTQAHAISTPDTAHPVIRFRMHSSGENQNLSILRSCETLNDASSVVHYTTGTAVFFYVSLYKVDLCNNLLYSTLGITEV